MSDPARERKIVVLEPSRTRLPRAVDVTLGLAVTTTRAGSSAVRVALLPARMLARAARGSAALRAAEDRLAATGRDAAERGLRTVVTAAEGVDAAPAIARALDTALAGPLPEEIAHSLVEHRIVERMVDEAELEDVLARALERGELVDRVIESPEFEHVLERVVASPAIRAALAAQTSSLAGEVGAGLRHRTSAFDDRTTHAVRERLGRAPVATPSPYGGLGARALALTLDVLALVVLVSVSSAVVGLVASLVGELRPQWLVVALLGAEWVLASSLYFLVFWSVAGQTPGMRLLHLRVLDERGEPPSFGRAVLRLAGLVAAIVPLFAGFLPVLVDARRRALQDLIARTVVVREAPGLGRLTGADGSDAG